MSVCVVGNNVVQCLVLPRAVLPQTGSGVVQNSGGWHSKKLSKQQFWLLVSDIFPTIQLEMWADAHRDGRPAEHRWRPLLNAAKFG